MLANNTNINVISLLYLIFELNKHAAITVHKIPKHIIPDSQNAKHSTEQKLYIIIKDIPIIKIL